MKKIVTYKFHLKPTTSQCKRIDRWIGACRYVYNLAKETKEYAYQSQGISLGKFDLIKQLPPLKDIEWIKDVDAQALQNVMKRLDLSYQKFFDGAGYPKWANKYKYNSFTQSKGRIFDAGILNVPKLGNIKFKDTRGLSQLTKIKTVTIKKEGNRYFASIVCEVNIKPKKQADSVIGIDMGVSNFYATSEGELHDAPMFYKENKKKLRILQRKLARQKKFGSNWNKTKKQIQKLHTKIANSRKDYQQKISTNLINENQVIVIEDLKVKNMTKSAKGNAEEPGKMVKQKSGLNRSILDNAFSSFFTMLEYKADWYGREVIRVNPAYTSQTCNSCGEVSKESRKKQKFKCTSCGHTDNADINAAKNILEKGYLHSRQRRA